MPHIEVLPNSGATSAPGWAYVPDTGYDPSKIAINPTARKRTLAARNATTASGASDLSSRQQRALQSRLKELDSDVGKDFNIPPKGKDSFQGRATPAVRKILTSGKDFRHYLDDEEATQQQSVQAGPPTRLLKTLASKDGPPSLGDSSAHPPAEPTHPLLSIKFPAQPTQEELDALLAAPPLSYVAAKVKGPPKNGPPQRLFCDICGYWGRIKCLLCGARVCGLECRGEHEERCNKFG